MDTKSKMNMCKALYRREIQDSVSFHKLICDRHNMKDELLYKRNLIAHFGCVNAIEFSNNGQFLVSGVLTML